MRTNFEKPVNIEEVLKYNQGIKPRYGKKGSTARGIVWCICGRCVGHLLANDEFAVGWMETKCTCGNPINWSEAKENL